MHRLQSFGKLLFLGFEQLNLLISPEQIGLRTIEASQQILRGRLAWQRLSGPPGSGLEAQFGPFVGLDQLQQLQLGAQSRQLPVEQCQVTTRATPLLLQENDVIRDLKSV